MGGEPDADFTAELALAITRLARHLTSGKLLTPGAVALLDDLEARGPATPAVLALRAGVSAPTMTRLVGRLEAAGLIERAPHPDDRRQIVLSLTERGVAELVRGRHDPWLAARMSRLEPYERELLRQATPVLARLYPAATLDGSSASG